MARVVQVTDDFPPFIGGIAAHAWELSRALSELGHDVEVLTGSLARYHRARLAMTTVRCVDNVTIRQIGFPLLVPKYRRRWADFYVQRYLVRSSSHDKPRVIHLHEHLRPLRFVRRTELAPLVWTNHSSMFLQDFEREGRREILNRLVNRCDWITAPSLELAEKTKALSRQPERVSYIPNGVDVERFRPLLRDQLRQLKAGLETLEFSMNDVVVLCARRFVPKNGVHFFVDAVEKLARFLSDYIVVLFAGNPEVPESSYSRGLTERVKTLSEYCRCHLLGEVPNERMPDLYRVADIVVLPSLQEATSISGLEAMSSALPIVGSDVGGVPEIVRDGENGLIFPSGDVGSLADALTKLIENRSLRKEMGREGRCRAEREFSWRTIAGRFAEVYEHALG